MNDPFPFGLPTPSAFYVTLYLATLLVHIFFMNYVLAGSAYLATALLLRGRAAPAGPAFEVLRDWMPFMLGAAITTGIAPLLFLQVLFMEQFYTANLLLFYRWMAILPALIAGFYLTYLLKTKSLHAWPLAGRLAVGCGTFVCFAFVGWSWVENHLLSVQPPSVWEKQYASGALMFFTPELLPRLALWFVSAFPTMALTVAWQLWDRNRNADARPMSMIGLVGIVLMSGSAGGYFFLLSEAARGAITGAIGLPYLVLSIVGGALQGVAWVAQLRLGRLTRGWLSIGSAGLVLNFIGMVVVNEVTRLTSLDATIGLAPLYSRHAGAWKVAGLPVFLFFAVVNACLIVWCVRLVRRAATQ